MRSTIIGHLEKDRYYDCDCLCSLTNPSQKYMVNESRAHEAKEDTGLEVSENRDSVSKQNYEILKELNSVNKKK